MMKVLNPVVAKKVRNGATPRVRAARVDRLVDRRVLLAAAAWRG
jgi:hypothetical protein